MAEWNPEGPTGGQCLAIVPGAPTLPCANRVPDSNFRSVVNG